MSNAKTKHTPGPWSLRRVLDARVSILGSNKMCIAECNEANGALIAAAPDLLAFIEDMLACGVINEKDAPNSAKIAKMLIAQARGEA